MKKSKKYVTNQFIPRHIYAGAEGRGGKQGPGPPLKYSAPIYIYN